MNKVGEILFTIFGMYAFTEWLSVYWCRNFPNRKFFVIKNRILFNILGSLRGRDSTQNHQFYPQQKITLTGLIMYIVNTIVLLCRAIFQNTERYFYAYASLFIIFVIIITLLEVIVYSIYKEILPKKCCFSYETEGMHIDKTICKSIYRYSKEILIDKKNKYYYYVEDTINFEKIGLLKLAKSGEVLDLTYKNRNEIDLMWKTHTRFNSYYKDRIKN